MEKDATDPLFLKACSIFHYSLLSWKFSKICNAPMMVVKWVYRFLMNSWEEEDNVLQICGVKMIKKYAVCILEY